MCEIVTIIIPKYRVFTVVVSADTHIYPYPCVPAKKKERGM